jgi:hypothetical protein
MTSIRKRCPFAIAIFEARYHEVDNQSMGQMPLHVKIEITHYDEKNDTIFDIDIDIDIDIELTVCDNARNVTEPISFY